MSLAPPWVLFLHEGKPKAILPAGRPGEVADVSHLTMAEARDIVRLANEIHDEIVRARFRGVDSHVRKLAVLIACAREKTRIS